MLSPGETSRDLSKSERATLSDRLTQRIRQIEAAIRTDRQSGAGAKTRDDFPKQKPSDGPRGVADVAKGFTDSARQAAIANSDLIREREKRNLDVLRGPDKMIAVVPVDGIAFPPYWKELSARRKAMVDQKLTEKEIAVLKALNSTMSLEGKEWKFNSLIEYLQDKTGLTIVMDEGSLRDANVDYESDTVTTKRIDKGSVRFILKHMLADKGLTYTIKEGAIQVMTPKKASE